jgi:hypothetical protein
MAQSITEGLFPSVAGLFSSPGAEQARRLELAAQPVSPLNAVSGDIGFLGERMRQGIGSAFGQMPEQDRKRMQAQQAAQELQQQGVDVSTPEGLLQLAQRLDALPGFTGESLAIRQAAAQMAQQRQMQGLEQEKIRAQTGLAQAQTEKAGREKPEQTLRPIQIDRGDRVDIVDPYSYETIRSLPKALSPTAQQRLEEGQVREGFNSKTGAYTNPYGEVFDRTEMRLNRQGFEEAQKLLQKLNTITAEDVKQAESLIDYTEPGVTKSAGQQLAPKTVNAQVKIAASQLLEQIAKLPPGSASDADMRAAVRDFPGYGNADNLADWVNRTKADLSASLARQQDTYGFRRQVEATPALELSTSRRQGRSGRAAAAQQPQQPEPATAGRGVPAGVDPALWAVMTDEEKAEWK